MRLCQDLLLYAGSVLVKIVTFFFLTDLCDSWKATPEQLVPPLSTININMCTRPSASASLCTGGLRGLESPQAEGKPEERKCCSKHKNEKGKRTGRC